MSSEVTFSLAGQSKLLVKQKHELGEWFGIETRNKYQITDESGQPVAFAAEQQKGILGFLFRQFFGHWRTFEIHFFNPLKEKVMTARQPFRFIFARLEVQDATGRDLGAIQQRFAIFTKKFDVQDSRGMLLLEVASPIFKFWTFPFMRRGTQVACVQKKWSGIFSEALTDKDTFLVDYADPTLSEDERQLVLAAALFIDLRYFEKKA